ncbi:MAG: CoA transferase, partial [Pseudomonadota bacterium]|nr:CoA transferase [Pseudomonadota bacterium]
VPKLSATPGRTRSLGPALGEHNAEVFAAIGIGARAMADLKQRGAI